MSKVALIACSSVKRKAHGKARDVYGGTVLKYAILYAEQEGFKKIFILSAKYGLITPDTVIDTYNLSLLRMSRKNVLLWALRVYEQLKKEISSDDVIYFFAGKAYRKHIQKFLTNICKTPYYNKTIGWQMQSLKGKVK